MKISSWNINSVRLRKELIKYLIEKESPDIILLQETKCVNEEFPSEFFNKIGFIHQYFEGEKSYNGVAILSRIAFENPFSLSFCNDNKRHISVRVNDVEIHNFYVPAGGDIPDVRVNEKFKHKLDFISNMQKWFKDNRDKSDKMILCGDLNIAPFEHDVWSSKQLKNIVSHTDIERESMNNLRNELEWVDCSRKFIPSTEKSYSWWSYRNKDWKKSNRGRRLDHIWVSKPLEPILTEYHTFPYFRDCEKPSDHIPILISLYINKQMTK